MGVNRLAGSPWHAERVHRAEGDDRRYKGRCEYYSYQDDRCTYRSGKCTGSAHCSKYKAVSESEFKERQRLSHKAKQNNKSKSKAKKDEDVYWF